MTESANEVVSVSVPARASYIRLARLVGAGLANDRGFDIERLDDVRLAIGEACSLGVQAGATTIELHFTGTAERLEVTGESIGPARPLAAEDGPEREHIDLVRQILRVACTDHRISRDDGVLSFWLAFDQDHGR